MEKTFVDSSVLAAFFNEEDALFKRAHSILSALAIPLLVHEYVLLETSTVLMTRASKTLADAFIDEMFTNAAFKVVPSSSENLSATAAAFKANPTKLSFTDAALLALSLRYQVATFDKALEKAIKKLRGV